MSELNRLRCRLRAVNIEYSELVRCKRAEVTYGRMARLRSRRCVLMALIAVERQAGARSVLLSMSFRARCALPYSEKSRQLRERVPVR